MSSPVSLLRHKLRDLGVQAFFLPHNDPHNNEYLASHDMRMPFLSGFHGSNGHILVTDDMAFLWTDGRYWLAAEKQLFPEWTMMKLTEGVPKYFEWVEKNMAEGSIIGYDPMIITADSLRIRKEYFEKKGFVFKGLDYNPVNEIWVDRPPLCPDPIFRHEDQYAGKTMKEKLDEVASNFKEKYLLTNALDEIAWLLNLRGNDIDFNPVFFSYLVIEKTDSGITPHFFIKKNKIVNVAEYLETNGVIVHDYEEIFAYAQSLADEVRVDGSKCSAALYEKIVKPINKSSIISELKAIKNPREIQGFRDSHMRDGLALCKYFAWLENELKIGNVWTEYTASDVLTNFRKQVSLNMGLSFGTISSVGANAAIIHYKPEKDTASNISNESIYLLDSGGHYLDGTIDTTRTVHFGTPTDWEKECYTRVLLGNFDLERMIWPNSWSISGAELDIMARRRLWEVGLEYNHGTGHGVGYYLNVHEGPQGISRGRKAELKVGMNVTNEPGYYEAGNFGIRIENVMFVQNHVSMEGSYYFENVTMVPYEINLIKNDLLVDSDKVFINKYHEKILNAFKPILEEQGDALTLAWLERKTSPIE